MSKVQQQRAATRAARKRVEAMLEKTASQAFSSAYNTMAMANLKEGSPIRCTVFFRSFARAMQKQLDEYPPDLWK